ncbi:MAG: hypothetical protein E7480_03665 [Ruminococcaceae bacterium]|nr:hypothetical protein [Oscillospiraceae bacterium]
MKIIVCLDDNNGMMFNNRRQSRDKEVYSDIVKSFDNILISPYSLSLFADFPQNVSVSENLLQNGWYFIEDTDISSFHNDIEEIVIYRWNRVYPADKHFDIDLSKYSLSASNEFTGNSHEKITKEIYTRQVN